MRAMIKCQYANTSLASSTTSLRLETLVAPVTALSGVTHALVRGSSLAFRLRWTSKIGRPPPPTVARVPPPVIARRYMMQAVRSISGPIHQAEDGTPPVHAASTCRRALIEPLISKGSSVLQDVSLGERYLADGGV